MAALQGAVRTLDRGLGRILDLMEEQNLLNNTILVVTTDHGIAVPRAKAMLYDAGVGVFLFIRDPAGGDYGGARASELVSHLDILPTLMERCGLPTEPQFEGQSLLPLLRGERDTSVRQAVFSEKTFFQFYDPMRSVRTERYRFIQNFELCRYLEIPSDCMRDGAARDFGDRVIGGHPQDELYDAWTDPHMLNNLAEDPAYSWLVKEHKRLLLAWMKETNDPLLRGHVTSPFHSRVIEELHATVALVKACRRIEGMS